MFSTETYLARRSELRRRLSEGVALFLGNDHSPVNYPDNPYPFRQDSTFLYFFGLTESGLAALLDLEGEKEVIFGSERSLEESVWVGRTPSLRERCLQAGVGNVEGREQLGEKLGELRKQGRTIHVLPPYMPGQVLALSLLFSVPPHEVDTLVSPDLVRTVVSLRSCKSSEEIEQIEEAVSLCAAMQRLAMERTCPGVREQEVVGAMEGLLLAQGSRTSFPTIFSVRGEILHNTSHQNIMAAGQLALNDCGAESPEYYAGDVTRTFPVSGRFSSKQRDIYEVVLRAQRESIRAMQVGVPFRDVHLLACRILAEGLGALGLMKGNAEEAVRAGAHALFFPCGLGHMIGLDVHDMEGLGEDYVGYTEAISRSDQFGLKSLRLARELQEGFCVTVEPGLYFIPALIDAWEAEGRHRDFVHYRALRNYRDFGGIRIEDVVVVTEEGARPLGPALPKEPEEIEAAMGR